MTRSTAIARSALVALLSLLLAAGAVAAAHHDAEPLTGLDRASDAAGMSVPASADEPDDDDPDEDADEPAAPAPDSTTTDPTTTGTHPENHGKYVSEAAHAETPPGCPNHGAYVRIIARSDLGKPGSETTEVPTSCDEPAADPIGTVEARSAKPDKAAKPIKPAHAKGHGHGLSR